MLSRITITTNGEQELSFTLSRKQFPIILAFATTIMMSLAQSLRHLGIDFTRDVFCYG